MTKQSVSKLNLLERKLPEGLVVDSAWLEKNGFSSALRSQYVSAGWLEQPVRGVYRRRRGALSWQQIIISLQTIIGTPPLLVGGRTALDLQGYAHFLTHSIREVHLYGPKRPPNWLSKLKLDVKFIYHSSKKLFRNDPITKGLTSLKWNIEKGEGFRTDAFSSSDLVVQPWGQWDWPLTLSTPERAVFELLDELPDHESFHQVDKLFEGLVSLSPRKLEKLLLDCHSVKVKRLFFFFADRHKHSWLRHLDKKKVELGTGKRSLVKGGKLDPFYQITVPADFDGVR